jgi:hypothetical protein
MEKDMLNNPFRLSTSIHPDSTPNSPMTITMSSEKPIKRVRSVNTPYGVDENKLEGRQRSCEDCGVEVGLSIMQCKKVRDGSFQAVLNAVGCGCNLFSTRHHEGKRECKEL